jgi:hypothetical protein
MTMMAGLLKPSLEAMVANSAAEDTPIRWFFLVDFACLELSYFFR